MCLVKSDKVASDVGNASHEDTYLIGWKVEKKSGFGFSSVCDVSRNGAPLYSDGRGHSMTVAATGAGKTVGLISRLLFCPQSAVIIDVKGEVYNTSHRHRRDRMGHEIILWDPTHCIKGNVRRDSFNPLDIFNIVGGDVEDFVSDTLGIIFDPANRSTKETYWDSMGEVYARGLLLDLMFRSPKRDRNLVVLWHRVFGEMCESAAIADKAVEAIKAKPRLKSKLSKAVKLITTTLDLPDQTRGGVVSTAQHHFNFLSSERVGTYLKTTSFDLKSIFKGRPFTLYLVVPPQSLSRLAPVLRLMLHALTLMFVKRENPLHSPIRLIVDEAGVIGKLDILQSQIALGRGFGLFIDLIFQDISQLQEAYEKGWKSLLGNCRYQHYFGFNSQEDAEVIARRTGFSTDFLMEMNKTRELMLFVENGVGEIVRKANYLRDRHIFEGRFDPNPLYL